MATYRNPWHIAGHPQYGPETYETDAKPTDYRGYLIYRRLPRCFDVVLDGECVTQRAGLNGAKRAIDVLELAKS